MTDTSHLDGRHCLVSRTRRIAFEQAALVADAFLDAPRTSKDPRVHAAYAELSNQASRWFIGQ